MLELLTAVKKIKGQINHIIEVIETLHEREIKMKTNQHVKIEKTMESSEEKNEITKSIEVAIMNAKSVKQMLEKVEEEE